MIDARRFCFAQNITDPTRNIDFPHDTGTHCVVNIVVDIGNPVGKTHNTTLQRRCLGALCMTNDAVAHFVCQIESFAVFFNCIHDAQTLLIMMKAEAANRIERTLACVSERRMTQVVTERNRFRQIFVQVEASRNRPRNLRHFKRMRQSGSVMIPFGRKENLCLMFQSAKCGTMDDPVAVTLKHRADGAFRFFVQSSPALIRKCSQMRKCGMF